MDPIVNDRVAAAVRAFGCEELCEYIKEQATYGGLLIKLRILPSWEDAPFRRLAQALVDCIKATEHAEQVPRVLAWMFVSTVPRLLTMMAHSDFLEYNDDEDLPEPAHDYFAQRRRLLQRLSEWFAEGRRPVSDEPFSLRDWSPTFDQIQPECRDRHTDDSRAGSQTRNEIGCEELREHIEPTERSLWFKLEEHLEWDEASFRRLVQALVDCLEATEEHEYVPRVLARMFVAVVPGILSIMNRPDFLQLNAGERSPEQARAYFARRQQLLEDLAFWFTDGRKVVRDERLSLGDWSPRFRRLHATGCEALRAYLQDTEADLSLTLRATLELDETSYRRLVQALIDCLEATEQNEKLPRKLVYVFVVEVSGIVYMMNRTEFAAWNARETDPDETKAYFVRRKQLLRDLLRWFAKGKRPFGDERLSVGDWSPVFRPIETTSAMGSIPTNDGGSEGSEAYALEPDEVLWSKVQSSLEWDEAEFRRMIQALDDRLEADKRQEDVPRALVRMLVNANDISFLIGHPDFIKRNCAKRTIKDAEAYFRERQQQIFKRRLGHESSEIRHNEASS